MDRRRRHGGTLATRRAALSVSGPPAPGASRSAATTRALAPVTALRALGAVARRPVAPVATGPPVGPVAPVGVGPTTTSASPVAPLVVVASARAGRQDHRASGARFGVPRTSMRPSVFSGERAGLAGERVRISMPSKPTSTSARRTDPTLSPAGTREPSTTPLGWRAPAARQVQLPSGVWLVSSMSIPRDMRRTRYRARLAAPTAEPGPASRNMVRCPQRRGVFPRGARRPP